MNWNYSSYSKTDNKHKAFISYYHKDDSYYRERFESLFGHLFINTSVKPGDIDTDDSDEYIKRLIQEGYISGASIIVVLIGAKTYCRKHVDWEISAALNKKVGGYSGLVGLLLPTHPDYDRDKYYTSLVPDRLQDNIKSGYAVFKDWSNDENDIKNWVEMAFKAREEKNDLIDNSRLQFRSNRCE